MIRFAEPKDTERIRTLWEVCFGDSKTWTDWFFSSRYQPKNTLCMERDGKIVRGRNK